MIVLDTNVVSELMRQEPDERVMAWMGRQPTAGLFTTTLTQAEIFYGLLLLPEGRRREALIAAARPVFDVDLAGASSRSIPTQRESIRKSRPGVAETASRSARSTRRLRPSCALAGRASQPATHETSPIAESPWSTLGASDDRRDAFFRQRAEWLACREPPSARRFATPFSLPAGLFLRTITRIVEG